MAIPNPNPNIADGMKCDNKTYSSNKIEDLVSAAGGDDPRIPDAEIADIGKVLGIVSDGASGAEYDLVSASGGNDPRIPDPLYSDIKKVLGVVSDGASGAEYGLVSVDKFIAHITYDPDDETYESDKTYNEIMQAINAGKMVYIDASECVDVTIEPLGLIPFAGWYYGRLNFRAVVHTMPTRDVVEAFSMDSSSSPMFHNDSYYYATVDN